MRSWAEGLEILNLESSLHKYLRNPTQVLFSNLSDWHSLLRCSTVPIRFVTASAVLQIGYYDLANICGERGNIRPHLSQPLPVWWFITEPPFVPRLAFVALSLVTAGCYRLLGNGSSTNLAHSNSPVAPSFMLDSQEFSIEKEVS